MALETFSGYAATPCRHLPQLCFNLSPSAVLDRICILWHFLNFHPFQDLEKSAASGLGMIQNAFRVGFLTQHALFVSPVILACL